jgi:hypothetical protein
MRSFPPGWSDGDASASSSLSGPPRGDKRQRSRSTELVRSGHHRGPRSALSSKRPSPVAAGPRVSTTLDYADLGSIAGSGQLRRRTQAGVERRRATDEVASVGWPGRPRILLPVGGQGSVCYAALRVARHRGRASGPGSNQLRLPHCTIGSGPAPSGRRDTARSSSSVRPSA